VSARLEAFVAGPDGAPWVTFIPGIGNDASFWNRQADDLSDMFRTLRFEPWGCGASDPPPTDCTIDGITDGIVELWDRLGIATSSVVGLGFGGSTALKVALRHAERVDRVVACCCRPRQPDDRREFWRERQARARADGLDALADVTIERWLGVEFRAARPDVDSALGAAFRRNSVEGYVAYIGAFIDMDFEAELPAVAAPTLIDAMRAMGDVLPTARLTIIDGSGHICNHEAPTTVANLLRSHLT
jgi:3-oxoadipate enol-lactonase